MIRTDYNTRGQKTEVVLCDDCHSDLEDITTRPYHGSKADGQHWCLSCYATWVRPALDWWADVQEHNHELVTV